jgi:hypothetical protein
MRHMAPFGQGNTTPVLCVRRIRVAESPRLVGQDHLKFTAVSNGARLNVIAWGLGSRIAEVSHPGAELDLAFKLEEDDWRPRGARNPDPPGSRVQARLLDMRPSE